MMQIRTHTLRLLPDASQIAYLRSLMVIRNQIWNKLITIREVQYKQNKKSMSDFDLINRLPALKKELPELAKYNSKAAQVIAQQISAGYRSFFVKLKNGDKTARPPRLIEDESKIVSLTFNQSGWIKSELKKNELKLSKKSSSIPLKTHLNLSLLNIKEIRVKLKNGKWLCDIVEEYDSQYQQNCSNKVLALDLGLKSLATGIDNDGNVLVLPNKAKHISKYFGTEIAKIDQKLSKTTKFSNRNKNLYKKRKQLFSRKTSQVKQALHIQSKQVANMNYQTIVLGDLSVKQLMSSEKNPKKVSVNLSHSLQ